jgi:hypothetical protein
MSSIKFEFSWKTLPWDQFREKLCLIQTQIFNLIKYKNFKKALVKQKLLLFSSEIYSLAIKEITQLRLDRKIPGIDKYIINSSYHRIKLLFLIEKKLNIWDSKRTRKVYLIDFLKGKILYWIPTMEDRTVQCIWKLVLEPIFNSVFFENQIFLSCLGNFLFIKYSVILKLLTEFHISSQQLIHLKWNIFSSSKLTFNRNYLLKIIFFPDNCKRSMINSVRSKLLLDQQFSNSPVQFYLHMFHFFVMSFGFFGLKYLFLKELNSKFIYFSNSANSIYCYFNEFICIFNSSQIEAYYLTVLNKLLLQNVLLNIHVSIENKYSLLGFDFLDWRFKFFSGEVYKLFPNSLSWLKHKSEFKRILKSNRYTFYQRLKFLRFLTHLRVDNNWFCSDFIFRKEFYILKTYLNKYIKNYSSLRKHEKRYFLEFVFKI